MSAAPMTLFDAYQLANKRRAALRVRALGWAIDGRDEHALRVVPRLRKGEVEVWYPRDGGETATTLPVNAARKLNVEREP